MINIWRKPEHHKQPEQGNMVAVRPETAVNQGNDKDI
mgnify:CR=1 FL=1